jgi:hypothetical protein
LSVAPEPAGSYGPGGFLILTCAVSLSAAALFFLARMLKMVEEESPTNGGAIFFYQ